MTGAVDDLSRPAGRGVFLFSDVEDSTVLWEQYPEAMAEAVAAHDRIITEAVEATGGEIVKRVGDAMDAKFDSVSDAVSAAVSAQRELAERSWGELGRLRVRMAIGAGAVTEREEGFFGPVLNQLGRILAAGHGGQVLLNEAAAAVLDDADDREDDDLGVVELGEFRFKGLGRPVRVFQLVAEGMEREFGPLRIGGPRRVAAEVGGEPHRIRSYELRQRLGEGPSGVVFLAWQTTVGREVAVKVISSEVANRPAFVRRFESAAQAVARLQHPHIVGLYDFWRDPDGAYLVRPYLRGGSVAAMLERGPWRPAAALTLVEQVGSALSFAHRHDVVHGDLKPSNVLLDEDGNAHISDFAIVAADDGATRVEPAYLAPEQRDGGRATVAADVFAFAQLTAEILTGDPPPEGGLGGSGAAVASRLPEGLVGMLERATATDPTVRHDTVDELVAEVCEVLGGDRASVEASSRVRAVVRDPYKGLRAFGEADAADFHGREALVDELLAAVAERRLVSVVGPSGSGKSSVVRAGLLPALRSGALRGSDGWLFTDLFPGSYPFEELEAALLRVAVVDPGSLVDELRRDERGLVRVVKRILPDDDSELVLVVDQFEELFTLVEDEGVRRLFLDQLATLVTDERSRVRVVTTTRVDLVDRPLNQPGFAELFKAGFVPVTPPSDEELEAAIVRPAEAVGLELEPGLAAEIIADVRDQPGSLPLLQHALSELFARREDGRLTVAAYRESGGVVGALARRAEEVYGELREVAREAARQVFLRLVALGDGTEDTRRRVRRAELLALPRMEDEVAEVLDAFGQHRLLSFDRDTTTREPTVEVAHEALLRTWDRLRGWIDEARDDLRAHRRLRQAAAEWREAGEDGAYLLPPQRVEATDAWLGDAAVTLADEEARFLDASRQRKEQLEAAEAERQAHEEELERRAVRRLRATIGVLGIGLLVAAGLTFFAFEQRAQAEAERVAAERSERVATARGLASAASAELIHDPERSILLGIEAVNATRDMDGDVLSEAETALRSALRASHITDRLEAEGGFASVSVAPDGRVATLSIRGTLTTWEPETWEPLLELDGMSHAGLAFYDDVEFSPDGSSFVAADDELRGAIRDTATGEVQVELEGEISWPTFSPDGRFVAGVLRREMDAPIEQDATVAIWDAATGEVVRRIEAEGPVTNLDFNSDGALLGGAPPVIHVPTRVWDVETGELAWSVGGGAVNIAFHPDDDLVAIGMEGGLVHLRDARDGSSVDTLRGHTAVIQSLAFSVDGDLLVTGDQEGVSRVWDVDERLELFVFPGHTAPLSDAAFVPGTGQVVTTSRDGTAGIWDLRVGGGYEYAALAGSQPTFPRGDRMSISPDSTYLATPKLDGNVRVRELATMDEVLALPHDHPVNVVAYGPDGEIIATGAAVGASPDVHPAEWGGELHLWDARSGDHLGRLAEYEHAPDDIVFSPDGSLLIAAVGPALRAYDVSTGDEVFVFEHEAELVVAAEFTSDGERIVVAGAQAVLVLDAGTGDVVDELIREEVGFFSVALVDDEHVVTGDTDGRVRVHDLATGEEVREFREEQIAAFVDVVDDLLAIVSEDVVTVRDLGSGERIFRVEYDEAAWANRPKFSPDGRFLVVAIRDVVHIHVLDMDDLLDLAHDRLTRWWTEAECDEFLGGPCPDPPS